MTILRRMSSERDSCLSFDHIQKRLFGQSGGLDVLSNLCSWKEHHLRWNDGWWNLLVRRWAWLVTGTCVEGRRSFEDFKHGVL